MGGAFFRSNSHKVQPLLLLLLAREAAIVVVVVATLIYQEVVLLHRELCERTIIVEFIDFRAKNHVINLISSYLCPGQSETESTDSLAVHQPAVELLLYDEQLWSLKRNNQSLPQFLLLYCDDDDEEQNRNKKRGRNLCTIFFYRFFPPTHPWRFAVKKDAVRIHHVTHYRRPHLHLFPGKAAGKGCESK